MLDHILIPLDGSELSERIVPEVLPLLRKQGASVRVLYVQGTGAGIRAYVHDECGRRQIHRVCALLESQGVDAVPALRAGDPAEQILRFADPTPPALIALSTHGRSGLDRLLHGSVAEEVLRHAGCPVLTANPHALPPLEPTRPVRFERILVPTDGSDRSRDILPAVREWARALDLEVTVMHVLHSRYGDVDPEAIAAEFAEPLRRSGLRVKTLAESGEPAERILRVAAAERFDLIALTTHGRTGLARLLYGSVTEEVLRSGACPVLVVRATAGVVHAAAQASPATSHEA